MAIVETDNLGREFHSRRNSVKALQGITIQVEEGEVFGLLGPNGAGKTTLIRILCTLLLPTTGKARIGGYDVAKEPEKIRPLINVASGAERGGYDFISARGNLWFFSQLYGVPSDDARTRIKELSETLGFDEHVEKKLYTLSTGYRQRLTIARAFINNPRIVFLDEPTVGLDVATSRRIREFIVTRARTEKQTVVLATHNMAEAEAVCDRVAIIDRGGLLACGSPESLKRSLGAPAFVMEVTPPPPSLDFLSSLTAVQGATSTLDAEREVARVKMIVENEGAVEEARATAESVGLKVLFVWRQEPTLEEVFLRFVGAGFAEREKEIAG